MRIMRSFAICAICTIWPPQSGAVSCFDPIGQLSDPRAPPQPEAAVLRRELCRPMSCRRASRRSSHQNSPGHSAMGLRVCLALLEHTRRLPLQHPLHGLVHVAAPVEGQKHTARVLLHRRVVAVHKVALRAQHAHRGVAPHAELLHLLGGDAKAPPGRRAPAVFLPLSSDPRRAHVCVKQLCVKRMNRLQIKKRYGHRERCVCLKKCPGSISTQQGNHTKQDKQANRQTETQTKTSRKV